MKKKIFVIGLCVFLAVFLFWYFSPFYQKYHFHIPTQFSMQNLPLVTVKVQDHEYAVKMDLGSKFQLELHKSMLDCLDKSYHEPLTHRDMEGRSYENSAYTLSSVEVGGLITKQVLVKEEDSNYIDSVGVIGGAIFSDKNVLLDFDYSVVYVSNDRHELEKLGYDWKEFVKIPYELGRHCVILKFNTDFGEARLALDTGCTVSFLRASFVGGCEPQGCKYGLPFVTSSKFELGGKDFGPMNLYLYNISPELTEFDGMLGMDFLIDHVVYIDREHKLVYVQDIATLSN